MAKRTINDTFWTDPDLKKPSINNRISFYPHIKEKVFAKYQGKCADCSLVAPQGGWYKNRYSSLNEKAKKSFHIFPLEIHHLNPVQNEGKNELSNLILVCSACHKIRHGAKPKKSLMPYYREGIVNGK